MTESSSTMNFLNMFLWWGLPLTLILIGYFIGRVVEREHVRSLDARESRLSLAIATNLKRPPPDRTVTSSFLVSGSVVIASDYYKTFGANLKTMIGGRLGTLETLMERGRREALLRMRESAATHGAQMVFNVRLESAAIASGGRQSMPSIEVLAYGTAVVFAEREG